MAGRSNTGRVMEEGYYLEKNPGKTSEDYNEMLKYHGGRGGDIGGGHYIEDEEGIPRNYEGLIRPGWSRGKGKGQVAVDASSPKSGNLRRVVQAQRKSLITGMG